LFSKEPGTVKWINSEFKPSQVFYDIGANIGLYTIMAGKRLGPEGTVYAFEPHAGNFNRLLKNIIRSNLSNIVIPCNTALDSEEGFSRFSYASTNAGTSLSQLNSGAIKNHNGDISELKYSASIDSLIESSHIKKPHHIKIDVDGNELRILQGMKKLLQSSDAPLTIQVELDPHASERIISFLKGFDYNLIEKHYSRAQQLMLEQTGNAGETGANGIFQKLT
jgi:FkbM family methyltransferase